MPRKKTVDNQLKIHRKKKENLLNQLARFDDFLNNFDANLMKLKVRLEQCQKIWSEFDEVQLQIEVLEEYNDDLSLQDRTDFEELYFQVISKANKILDQSVPQAEISSVKDIYPQFQV